MTRFLRLCLLLFAMSAHAQSPAVFTPLGLPTGSYAGCSIIPTPDGGFIVCYSLDDVASRNRHLRMGTMKMMPDGRVDWNRIYEVNDGIPGSDEIGSIDGIRRQEIVRNRDGNYVIAGELVRLTDYDHKDQKLDYESTAIIVMVIDPMGEEITHHVYASEFRHCLDGTFASTESDRAICTAGKVHGLIATDSALIMLAHAHGISTIAWLTHDGALMNARRIGMRIPDAYNDKHSYFGRILADSTGGLVYIAGEEYRDRALWSTTITRFDSSGTSYDSRAIPDHLNLWFGDVMILENGRVMLTGRVGRPADSSDPSQALTKVDTVRGVNAATNRLSYVKAALIIDHSLERGTLTKLSDERSEPWIDQTAVLANNEIVLIHSDRWRHGKVTGYLRTTDGYSIHSADGTFLSDHAIGPLIAVEGLNIPDGVDHRHTLDKSRGLRSIALSTDEAAVSATGSLLLVGSDWRMTPYFASFSARLPIPCVENETLSIDTVTSTFLLEETIVTSRVYDPPRKRLDRRFAISQYDLPIDLFPLCDVPPSVDSAGALLGKNALINVDELVLSAGQSIEATLRVPFTTSIRAIRADDGEIVWERALSGMETPQRMSIPTSGWTPGVYILAIERGGSVKVLLRP